VTVQIQNHTFLRDGLEYTCTSLSPHHYLRSEHQTSPHESCLGGFFSWKRCDGHKYLCKSGSVTAAVLRSMAQKGVSKCKDVNRLTPDEFRARYRCFPETTIARSMKMLSDCQSETNTQENTTNLFWESQTISSTHLVKIQIVDNSLYYSFKSGVSVEHGRFRPVIRDILTILDECTLPDSELFLWGHDGCSFDLLPHRNEHGKLCVPLFVQEIPLQNSHQELDY
jgi:hypothetical protein